MSNDQTDIISIMSDLSPWFDSLDVEDKTAICEHCSMLRIRKDDILFKRGENVTHLAMIKTGTLWAERVSIEGRNHVMAVLGPGFMGHWDWVFDVDVSKYDIKASVDSEIYLVPLQKIRLQIAKSNHLLSHIARSISKSHSILEDFHFVLSVCSNLEKVSWVLCLVASGYQGLSKPVNVIPVSQLKIAESLRLSRQTLNQTIRRLADLGIISVSRESVQIEDFNRLARLSYYCDDRQ